MPSSRRIVTGAVGDVLVREVHERLAVAYGQMGGFRELAGGLAQLGLGGRERVAAAGRCPRVRSMPGDGARGAA
ncbi:hypothetical protein OG698_44725 [Streptomyces sp. NBC_01003]|uniref:hypothetical protein n=1 Tax=Streptomyces sp. NBC_01003 TaxID=2903714 RepID=UPI0038661471|nr:hypothetical protein OG698_44725 [Streptomyces sp. NBC_01003]